MAATNIAQEISRLTAAKADIKEAIEGKGVTVPSSTLLDGYADLIEQIEQGATEEAPENDVNFYDYDGFRVASYTIEEAKALTELPTPPSHEGLTFQEWNWSLADIQGYNRRYIDIGANYITSDGNTHIFATIPDNDTDTYIYMWWGQGTLQVDWGDGSEPYSLAKTTFSGTKITHTYAHGGDYDVVLSFTQSTSNGCYGAIYMSNSNIYWPFNFIIKEWRSGHYVNFTYNSGISYRVTPILLTIATDSIVTSIQAQYNRLAMIAFPRGCELTGCTFLYSVIGRVCFPKEITSINSAANPLTYTTTSRIVLPEMTSATGTTAQAAHVGYNANIVSYPMSWKGALANFAWINEIEIVNGWVPVANLTLSTATRWLKNSIVDFLTKLGTTATTITLTLGAENLNKLTAEEKAIATDKGYTLA